MCLSPQLGTHVGRKSFQHVLSNELCYGQPITPCTCMLQELFLHSPCPTAALQMRKDLQHWPQALSLANQLDPTQIPPLACNYAQVSSVCMYTNGHPAALVFIYSLAQLTKWVETTIIGDWHAELLIFCAAELIAYCAGS